MRHRKLQELIGAYADGELRAADCARVEKHLAKCPECRRDVEFIRRIEGLPRTSPSIPQEADYWASFSGRVRSGIARRDAGAPASRSAEAGMFKDSFYKPEKMSWTRAVLFPLSLAGHAAVPRPTAQPISSETLSPSRADMTLSSVRSALATLPLRPITLPMSSSAT